MDHNILSTSGTIFNIQKFSVNDGPGIRTVVFFKGCPLRCKWCSNPESQALMPQKMGDEVKGIKKTVKEIMAVVMQDEVFYKESGGGITLSGGEILSQPELARVLLIAAKANHLHTCCETTGYAPLDTFLSVIENVDMILFDLKHWNAVKHKDGTGVSNEQILFNMKAAVKAGKEILPRIPIIPDFNDSLDDAKAFSDLLKEIGIDHCQLLPFHQFGENKYHLLDKEYDYEGRDSLHPEDLAEYLELMNKNGIQAFC